MIKSTCRLSVIKLTTVIATNFLHIVITVFLAGVVVLGSIAAVEIIYIVIINMCFV